MLSVQHNLTKVINASGRMSILGVSNIKKTILEAMEEGASNYYLMEELHLEAGKYLASKLKTESAYVVNSASAGISLAVAGVITRGQPAKIKNLLSKDTTMNREIILMRGHNINYGAPITTMIELAGGEIVEAGYANGCTREDIEKVISDNTAGIVYVQSHHCVQKNMPEINDVQELALKYNLPLILDAAAEESLTQFSSLADLIIYSGSKALEGPTSGILAGKEKYVNYAKDHHYGLGRAMKIGKEAIFGLLKAVEQYEPNNISKEIQLSRLEPLKQLNKIEGINVTIVQDAQGRDIYRGQIVIDATKTNTTALKIVTHLKSGNPAIYTRDYLANKGSFEIDPRPLKDEDCKVIVDKIKSIVN